MKESVVKKDIVQTSAHAVMPEVRKSKNFDHFFSHFEMNIDSALINEFCEHVNKGSTPLIVSNHQSHSDGLGLSLITETIKQKCNIEGFYLPIAASMFTGHQGPQIQYLTNELKSACQEKGLHLIPVTRKKDREKYGIKDKNIDSLRKMRDANLNNFGNVFLPEGTVQGGRINEKDGLIFGMVEVDKENVFEYIANYYLKEKINFCLLPVAIDGSYKLFSPDTYQIGIPDSKIKITATEILLPQDFSAVSSSISDFIMPRIGKNLSFPASGIYRMK